MKKIEITMPDRLKVVYTQKDGFDAFRVEEEVCLGKLTDVYPQVFWIEEITKKGLYYTIMTLSSYETFFLSNKKFRFL